MTIAGLLLLSAWITEDIDKGYSEAKRANMPLLVSFR
jgi:hypothetical protein